MTKTYIEIEWNKGIAEQTTTELLNFIVALRNSRKIKGVSFHSIENNRGNIFLWFEK